MRDRPAEGGEAEPQENRQHLALAPVSWRGCWGSIARLCSGHLGQLDAPVVVAVVAVGMVQVPVHQIVEMVAMRDRLVPAAGAVLMGTLHFRRAACRIGRIDADHVLVDVIAMHVMQMAVMQIVDVAFMAECQVTAVRAVLMGMVRMVLLIASRHGRRSFCFGSSV